MDTKRRVPPAQIDTSVRAIIFARKANTTSRPAPVPPNCHAMCLAGSRVARGESGAGLGTMRRRVKAHEMGLRAKNCGRQASQISARLWMAREVPVEMVIRQGTICRQWNELQTLLGGLC